MNLSFIIPLVIGAQLMAMVTGNMLQGGGSRGISLQGGRSPQNTLKVGTLQPAATVQQIQPAVSPYGATFGGGGGGGTGQLLGVNAYQEDPAVAQARQAQARAAAEEAAYYDDMEGQLNSQLGQLDQQQQVGFGNINSSYNQNINRLNDSRAKSERNYNTATQQNTQGYLNNRNGIMQNTRATANALQRLLGVSGSGNSSAAYEQAPYAAGLQGTQQLGQAQQTYSTNGTGIETNWQDTLDSFKNTREDYDNQKFQQENKLKATIAQTRAGLLDKIGEARFNRGLSQGQGYEQARAARTPYQQQVDSLLSQITGLGSQFQNSIALRPEVKYEAPKLGEFSLQNQAAPVQGGQPGASDVDGSFLGLLTGERDRFGNLIR